MRLLCLTHHFISQQCGMPDVTCTEANHFYAENELTVLMGVISDLILRCGRDKLRTKGTLSIKNVSQHGKAVLLRVDNRNIVRILDWTTTEPSLPSLGRERS